MNACDKFGYSPLHLAAINENSSVASVLISSGADLSAKTNGGVSALLFLVRKTPDVIPTISRRIDSAVMIADHDPLDADCEVHIDFSFLIPSSDMNTKVAEAGLLTALIGANQRSLLQHPVCRAFLHLKWHKVRALFLFSLFFHASFVFCLTANILSIYLYDPCAESAEIRKQDSAGKSSRDCLYSTDVQVISILTLFLGLLFVLKEVFQLAQSVIEYVHNLENWIQFTMIVGAVLVNIKQNSVNDNGWQQQASALITVLAWSELMMHIGRFPVFSLYVQMFTTVAANISKFLLAYLCLIIGFSLGLALLFPENHALSQLPYSLLTTFVMMTGELDYGNYFYHEEDAVPYPGMAHVIFFAFLLLIVLVLMNLLVGLAVSDIQGLRKSAGLDRLVRQARLISRMENIVFSAWLNFLPSSITRVLQNRVLMIPSLYHRVFTVRPNDPRDERIPQDVKEGLITILATNRTHKRQYGQRSLSCSIGEDGFNKMDESLHHTAQLKSLTFSMEQRLCHLENELVKTNQILEQILLLVNPVNKMQPDVCAVDSEVH